LGSYSKSKNEEQDLNKEQFAINDTRSLGEIIDELIDKEFLRSFCTACYRLGRTGEHFMEFSVPGFIKRFCTPNAILTLAEYLTDYATPELSEKGWNLVEKELQKLNEPKLEKQIREKLEKIKNGERDLYF
jgi:2-iminoacetate synthase